ncbi:MAG: hypothetical protein KAR24_00940 [Candidatus Pacebacteria bacterium]|nr:hypothetical protein [Candidatus Paceibacterota bacterium]
MQKKVLQDIQAPHTEEAEEMSEEGTRPKRKWDYGSGDIGIMSKNKKASEENEVADSDSYDNDEEEEESYSSSPQYYGVGGRKGGGGGLLGFSRMWWAVIIGVTALILFVLVWSMFATANVRVVLSQQTTTLNDSFNAVRSVGEDDGVVYQIVKLQETMTQDVASTGEEDVERKASGQIIVYSEHGDILRLIVNTRFQSPDGKIYRVNKAIVVPGAKKDTEGNLVPGSLEVTVYADEPGEEYNNGGIVDFTVPGLLGQELYDKVYARSKTEIIGGFDGVLKYASEEDIENASRELRQKVREKLLANIGGTIGDDRILYDDTIFIDFTTDVPTDVSGNGMLAVKETGLLRAFVFDRKELSSAIAKKSLSSFDGSVVVVKNLNEMTFVFEEKDEFDTNISDAFTFMLSGDPHVVWEIDTALLKNDLAGLSEDEISNVIKNHSSIRKITKSIKPFWKSSFPDNPDAITIEEVLE